MARTMKVFAAIICIFIWYGQHAQVDARNVIDSDMFKTLVKYFKSNNVKLGYGFAIRHFSTQTPYFVQCLRSTTPVLTKPEIHSTLTKVGKPFSILTNHHNLIISNNIGEALHQVGLEQNVNLCKQLYAANLDDKNKLYTEVLNNVKVLILNDVHNIQLRQWMLKYIDHFLPLKTFEHIVIGEVNHKGIPKGLHTIPGLYAAMERGIIDQNVKITDVPQKLGVYDIEYIRNGKKKKSTMRFGQTVEDYVFECALCYALLELNLNYQNMCRHGINGQIQVYTTNSHLMATCFETR